MADSSTSPVPEHTPEAVTDDSRDWMPYSKIVSMFHQFVIYFSGAFIFVIIILGLVGNLVSIVIFTKLRKKVIFSTFYFLCLAIFDTIALCVGIQPWLDDGAYVMVGSDAKVSEAVSKEHCIVLMFAWIACGLMSSWMLFMFCVERTMSIWKTLWVSTAKHLNKVMLISVVLGSFVIALGVVPVAELDTMDARLPGRKVCRVRFDTSWQFALALISVVIAYSALPLLSIIAVDIALVYGLYKRDHTDPHDPEIIKAKRYYDWQVAMTLFAVSTMYVVTMVPCCVAMTTYLVDEFQDWRGRSQNYQHFSADLLEFANKLTYINFSCKFLVYLCSLDFYRLEWAHLLLCWCPDKISTKKPGAYGLYVVNIGENGISGQGRFHTRNENTREEITDKSQL